MVNYRCYRVAERIGGWGSGIRKGRAKIVPFWRRDPFWPLYTFTFTFTFVSAQIWLRLGRFVLDWGC